jgi:MFS family permease
LSPLATFLSANPDEVGYGLGYSLAQVSLTQTALLLVTVVAALIAPLLISKLGSKNVLLYGLGLCVLAFALLAKFPLLFHTVLTIDIAVFVGLSGLGLGIVSAAIPIIIPQAVEQQEKGLATGLFNSAQTLGGALGGGLFLALLQVGATVSATTSSDSGLQINSMGYTVVWATCSGLLLLALVLFALLYRPAVK